MSFSTLAGLMTQKTLGIKNGTVLTGALLALLVGKSKAAQDEPEMHKHTAEQTKQLGGEPDEQNSTPLGGYFNYGNELTIDGVDEAYVPYERAYGNKLQISGRIKEMIKNDIRIAPSKKSREEDLVYYIWGKGYYMFGGCDIQNQTRASLKSNDEDAVRYYTGNGIAKMIRANEGNFQIGLEGKYNREEIAGFFAEMGNSKVAIITDFAEGKPTWVYGTNWRDFHMIYDNGNDTQKPYITIKDGKELISQQKLNTAPISKCGKKLKDGTGTYKKGTGNGHLFKTIKAEWEDNQTTTSMEAIAKDMVAQMHKAHCDKQIGLKYHGEILDVWNVNVLATGSWRLEENKDLFVAYKEFLEKEVATMNEESEGTIELTVGDISNDKEAEYGSMSFSKIDGFVDNARKQGNVAISCEFGGGSIQIGYFDLTNRHKYKVDFNENVMRFRGKLDKTYKKRMKNIKQSGYLQDPEEIKAMIVRETLGNMSRSKLEHLNSKLQAFDRSVFQQDIIDYLQSQDIKVARHYTFTPFKKLRRMLRL